MAVKFSFGMDGAYLAHMNAFVFAGFPTTSTFTDFFAHLSKAWPCDLRMFEYNVKGWNVRNKFIEVTYLGLENLHITTQQIFPLHALFSWYSSDEECCVDILESFF